MNITKLFLGLLFISVITTSYAQKSKKSFLFSPSKYGAQFVQGNEQNFLFDDTDYYYKSNSIKGQFFYPLTRFKTIAISLLIQPQVQFVKHQLLNEHFVRPEEDNYQVKRQQFTKLKNLSITALEFTVEAKQQLFTGFSLYIQASLGLAYIDTETERLAQGFTFIENGTLGFDVQLNSKTSIQLFSGLGHVSNFNFTMPNSGYNTMNTGIGFLILY
ncbi:MAG: acyloxyacyl hydrolase [Flavobacteriaceae bacterium]|nr:acyloxyacyl hydrolase [Flavobacteriaceae bacterium]